MAEAPILVIALDAARATEFREEIAALRVHYQNAKIILLTSRSLGADLEETGLCHEIWREGPVRGLVRLLALIRRISWMGFSDVHDLQQNSFTRLLKYSVWPRPHWHQGGISAVS